MAYEEIVMVADGKAFTGWTSISVTAEFGAAVRKFDISVTEVGSWSISPFAKWRFPPSTKISLLAGSSLLIDGWIDDYNPQGDGSNHTINIRGRGNGRGFVDCSCYHDSGQFENRTIMQIAQALAAPFGATIGVASTAAAAAAEVIPWFQIRRGATPWAEMMRLLPQRGITMTGKADGSIEFMRTLPTQHEGGLIQGKNIQRMSALLSDAGLFTDYEVTGQGSVGSKASAFTFFGEAAGKALPQYRRNEFVDMAETDTKRAREHAKWRQLRATGYGRQASITTPGFRDEAGALWEPGQQVFVFAPWLKIEQSMMIKEVEFVQDSQEGTISNLTLVDPRAGGGAASGTSGTDKGIWDFF